MNFRTTIIAFILSLLTVAAVAKTNDTQTLFDKLGGNEKRFEKACGAAFKTMAKKNESIDVVAYNSGMKTKIVEGKYPESLFVDMGIVDADKDGKVNKDEFCGSVLATLKTTTVKEFKSFNVSSQAIDGFKSMLCINNVTNKLPGLKKTEFCQTVAVLKQIDQAKEVIQKQQSKATLAAVLTFLSALAFILFVPLGAAALATVFTESELILSAVLLISFLASWIISVLLFIVFVAQVGQINRIKSLQ